MCKDQDVSHSTQRNNVAVSGNKQMVKYMVAVWIKITLQSLPHRLDGVANMCLPQHSPSLVCLCRDSCLFVLCVTWSCWEAKAGCNWVLSLQSFTFFNLLHLITFSLMGFSTSITLTLLDYTARVYKSWEASCNRLKQFTILLQSVHKNPQSRCQTEVC